MRRSIIVVALIATFLGSFSVIPAASQVTAPAKPDSVRMAVIGDMGTGETPQYEVSRRMMEAHTIFPFDFVIMLGDNIYGGSTSKDFNLKFSVPYKPLLDAGVKFYASLGNHDNTNESLYAPYNMNGATYYTFKKGNVRFFALNSNYMDPKQLAWLENELKSAGDGDWKVCYFHHPLYSSGKAHGSSVDLRQVLEPMFIKYHVDIVFSGHDHVYERVKPQKGIYYFTEGASGELRPGDLNQSSITAKGFDSDNTFMLVEFAGNEMNFQTISRSGQSVDSGVIERQVRSSANSSQPELPGPGRLSAGRREYRSLVREVTRGPADIPTVVKQVSFQSCAKSMRNPSVREYFLQSLCAKTPQAVNIRLLSDRAFIAKGSPRVGETKPELAPTVLLRASDIQARHSATEQCGRGFRIFDLL